MSSLAPAPLRKTAAKARFLRQSVERFWESLAPLIFPPVCVLCGEPTGRGTDRDSPRRYATFCVNCETSLLQSQPMMRTACEQCGWPRQVRSPRGPSSRLATDPLQEMGVQEMGVTVPEPELLPCPKCAGRSFPHRFARMTPLYRYHDAARTAVVAAKYPCNSAVTRELAMRLADRCRSRWPDLAMAGHAPAPPLMVTSVPSPWIRQVRRGGSGTRLLAQYTAKNLRLPYVSLLRTTRPVAKQALLDDDARHENVRGAFHVGQRWRQTSMDCDIILVDDVMTTGATADEVAGVLMDAGARRVSLAVVALAMRDS
ncbi:ComF family protein [Allorhodopirellula heiligendammensis]|nr:ComF family protein [Allorhodopirellula heiligendammensis]